MFDRERSASADTGYTTAHLTRVTDARLHQVVKNFGRDCAKAFWDAGAVAIDQIYSLVESNQIECEFQWVPGYLHASLGSDGTKERDSLEQDAALAAELGFRAQFVEEIPYTGTRPES